MSVIGSNVLAGASGGAGAAEFTIERSLRFNSGDSAYLSKTPTSAGNRRTWTWSGWVKRATAGAYDFLFMAQTSSVLKSSLSFWNSDIIRFKGDYNDGTARNFSASTNALFRDPSAWYHVVCRLDTTQATEADRIKIWVNGVEQTFSSATYPTQNSDIEFNNTSEHLVGSQTGAPQNGLDGYLAEVHFIDGQALAATDFGEYDATTGVWNPIEYTGTYGTNGFHLDFSDNSNKDALGTDSSGNSNTWTVNNIASGTDRDYTKDIDLTNGDPVRSTNDIYDIFDGNTSTGAETDNGDGNSLLFDFANGSGSIPVSTNIEVWVGGSGARTLKVNGNTIATNTGTANNPHTITGQSQLNSVEVVSESGTRSGFLLQISVDGSALVSDNPVTVDSLIDTPMNYEASSGNNGGNYCTWNPLEKTGSFTLANGNLATSNTSDFASAKGTMGFATGKWYYEATVTTAGAQLYGISTVEDPLPASGSQGYIGKNSYQWAYQSSSGNLFNNDAVTSFGSLASGDIAMIAFDVDGGKVWFGRNGTWYNSGNPATGSNASYSNLSGAITPAITEYTNGNSNTNFGQRPFAHTPPSGFKSLCTQNLPDPTIADGSDYFDVITRNGLGSSGGNITGLGFSPDLVWEKARGTTSDHYLMDTVRGATKDLRSNQTNAENTNANYLTAFNSDGYTVGSADWSTSTTVVSWAWDAGTSNTSISAGSLNSSAYNQSDVWSDDFSATRSAYPATNAFDGSITTYAHAADSAGSVTWTPATAVSYNSLVRVYALKPYSGVNSYVSLNGGTGVLVPSSGSGSGNWVTVATGSGSITSISSEYSNTYRAGIYAIEVDGKILVDTGVTPPNVPSVNSTVRANTSSGFSIVSYTGGGTNEIVGHGLNAAPSMMIVKRRDDVNNWRVGHDGLTDWSYRINMESTGAQGQQADVWNSTAPTSSVFSIGTSSSVNYNTGTYIAYCFAPIEGYSAFGSYTGNGNADGPFVFTGFRPRFLLLKNADATGVWSIFDTERDTYNVMDARIEANSSAAEGNSSANPNIVDALSNGFKVRYSGQNFNGSNNTIIYAAFGDPFKTARAR